MRPTHAIIWESNEATTGKTVNRCNNSLKPLTKSLYSYKVNPMNKKKQKSHRQPTTDTRWLSIEDVISQFGLSISTQQRMRKDGTLPHSKIGRVIRYDRLKIDAMFESHEVV